MTEPTRPVLRYHGGKWRLGAWVISFFPPHRVYVEPYGGAASVLLQKPRAESEIYNDLDDEVVNVFRVLREPASAQALKERIELTPFATRGATSGVRQKYRFEMDEADHIALADVLHATTSMVVLSGYPCDLYDQVLYRDWERHEKHTMADGANPRTEVLWVNKACATALRGQNVDWKRRRVVQLRGARP